MSSVKKALRERQKQSRKTEKKETERREDSAKENFSSAGSVFSVPHCEMTLHFSVACGAIISELMRGEQSLVFYRLQVKLKLWPEALKSISP